ncbi:uncharacterized protein LOC107055508 isoform X1 [Gallus gallus]|uniref:uncharacterized protein LOC107055509 isoform X1 n=1 Tax=Gallus gallus TaxID=9031 RepID=UPI001F000B3F|nr:uncharacterized protein LOC107055509 isoform X1 [Gallus gallus]XP_046765341.1 uncharacterized protein LOC107055508 isoform X1 [Gallus gallus]XP_046765602.1 uncharacterized protein LOC107055508 isoform X1 [Gallus gallus]XP_046765609.1 uncharacterized protein LOC107055509 isoform X1 [Gallus gallus]
MSSAPRLPGEPGTPTGRQAGRPDWRAGLTTGLAPPLASVGLGVRRVVLVLFLKDKLWHFLFSQPSSLPESLFLLLKGSSSLRRKFFLQTSWMRDLQTWPPGMERDIFASRPIGRPDILRFIASPRNK